MNINKIYLGTSKNINSLIKSKGLHLKIFIKSSLTTSQLSYMGNIG